MRTILVFVVIIAAGAAVWYLFGREEAAPETPRQQPVAQSKYSDSFNVSVGQFLDAYYSLSEALVNWDSTKVVQQAQAARDRFDAIRFTELQKDPAIYQTATSMQEFFRNDFNDMISAPDLEARRRSFNSVSQNLYTLLQAIRFDRNKIYLQECPMAFNDTETALWLSRERDIRNPYLGLYHPKYKSGMLECGETKDSLNYAAQ